MSAGARGSTRGAVELTEKPSRWLTVAGPLLMLFGAFRVFWVGLHEGTDFQVFYDAAVRYRLGLNPYIEHGDPLRLGDSLAPGAAPVVLASYGYPPLNSALFYPLSFVSNESARQIWAVVSLCVLIAGLYWALRAIAPNWSSAARALLLGLALSSVSFRWVVAQLQVSALVIGALGFALAALTRRKDKLLIIAGVLASLKPTLFLPVIVCLLFQRRYRLLATLGAVIVSLNFVAALPTGLRETAVGYRLVATNFSAPGTNNHADIRDTLRSFTNQPQRKLETTPGTIFADANGFTGEQLHWTYVFSAFTTSTAVASAFAGALTLATLFAFFLLWYRSERLRADAVFQQGVFAAAVCLSLLCVYHQRYDIALVFFPISIALVALQRSPATLELRLCVAICFVVGFAYVNSIWAWWIAHVVIPTGFLWLVPLRALGVTIALLCLMRVLFRYVAEARQTVSNSQIEGSVASSNEYR